MRRARAGNRARKLALWIGAVLVVLLLLPLIAARILLTGSRLQRLINTDPDRTELLYDRATGIWPGRVTLHNLRVRASDSNVQWFFRMEEARVTYSLLDLLDKRFHATRVRARGLVFRLREFPGKEGLSRAKAALLPSIPGFADPPRPAPPEKPGPPSTGREWAVHVEHLVAEPATEIWIENYRFRGRARVTGGFFLRPHERAEVGPAAVEFLDGSLHLGPDRPILSSFTGRADCRIEPFDQDEVTGDEVWPFITGAFRLEGPVANLAFLNYYLGENPEPRLSGGSGRGRVAMQVERGVGRGVVELDAREVSARYPDTTLGGRLAVRLNVARWEPERRRFDVSKSRIALEDVRTSGSRTDTHAWWGRFDLPEAKIAEAFSADVRATCRDGRPLFTLFDIELPKWTRGLQSLEGLTATAAVRLGKRLLVVDGLDAKGGSFHIEGSYVKRAGAKRGAFLIDAGSVNVGVAIGDGKTSLKLIDARGWFESENGKSVAARRAAGPPQRSRSTTTAVP